MSIDKELIAIGNSIIAKINYDFNTKYSAFTALKLLFSKDRENVAKLNKIIH